MAVNKSSVLSAIGGLVVGLLFGALVVLAYPLVMHAFSSAVVVACEPTNDDPDAYCLDHRTTPGLLGDRHTLLIRSFGERGLRYEVPYARDQVDATWAADTGVITITMPGTQLIIERDEYVDSR